RTRAIHRALESRNGWRASGGRGWNVAPRRNDDCYLAPDQIRRQCWQSIVLALGRLVLDCDVLTLEISGLLEALKKRRHQVGGALDRSAPEEPDHRHRRLLRACRERPSRRAAEQRDEFAAFHSITSSASASSLHGQARSPSRTFDSLRWHNTVLLALLGIGAVIATALRVRRIGRAPGRRRRLQPRRAALLGRLANPRHARQLIR